jgi:hypothetical protein
MTAHPAGPWSGRTRGCGPHAAAGGARIALHARRGPGLDSARRIARGRRGKDGASQRSRGARRSLRHARPRDDAAHRDDGRVRDLPHHGLHRRGQPGDHGSGQDRPRRRLRRHLPGRGDRLGVDGALGELPDRARAGDGAQRLLRLRRGAGHGRALAGGAGRGVRRWRSVLRHLRAARPGMAGERHPAVAEVRHRGGDRLLPRADRAARHGAGGGAPGDAGGARADFGDPGRCSPARASC